MNKDEWLEKYGSILEEAYHKMPVILSQNDDLWGVWMDLDSALVKLGLLEADEEPEEEEPEDTNDATHWDEWMIDNAIDRAREDEDV